MAEFIWNDAQIYFGQHDFSGNSNSVSMEFGADILEINKFNNNGFRSKIAGLKNVSGNIGGFFDDAGVVDEKLYNSIGSTVAPFTISPAAEAENALAYFSQGLTGTYNYGGEVGGTGLYDLQIDGHGDLIKGRVLDFGAKTGSGQSTGFELGTVSAGETLYAAIHVTAFTGTDFTAKVQRDTVGFGAPTDIITFTQFTDVGYEFASDSTVEATDDYYRLDVSGTFTSVTIFAVVGIK
jgi:hypothetical protein